MKILGTGFLALALVVIAGPVVAHAQSATEDTGRGPSQRFGRKGQIAISSDAALSIEHTSPVDQTTITLAPAADFFVADNLSVGGFISLQYTNAGDTDTTRFGIGPRVGYNLVLSDLISVWPKIGLSFSHTSRTTEADVDDDTTASTTLSNNGIALNLFVPIMFHPAEHFFAGFGPFLDTDLTGDDKATSFGLKLTLGGWLD